MMTFSSMTKVFLVLFSLIFLSCSAHKAHKAQLIPSPMIPETQPSPTVVSVESVGTLVDNKCSICMKSGLKSTVTLDLYGTCTAMACISPTYDENGKPLPQKPCNTCSFGATCSRGHKLVVNQL